MGIFMPCPIKRAGSDNWYFRTSVPKDVRAQLAAIPRARWPKGWGKSEIWISLRTSDKRSAKEECARVTAEVERQLAGLRAAPVVLSGTEANKIARSLTHMEATALASAAYKEWAVDENRRVTVEVPEVGHSVRVAPEHLPEGVWTSVIAKLERLKEENGGASLLATLGPTADRLLAEKAIWRVTNESREMLAEEILLALKDAFTSRRRNAQGDYSPDPKAGRFPAWSEPKVKISFDALLAGWEKERSPKRATIDTYHAHLDELARFVGHNDAGRIATDDILRWKDHLVASGRLKAKTINEKHLAAVKAVFGWAKANRKLAVNPAQGVAVKAKAEPQGRSKGFKEEEALAILRASQRSATPTQALAKKHLAARRWIPWICCYSGARVAEVAQLRKEDIRREEGIWVMVLTPEAGSIKSGQYRYVPIHAHLLEQGLLDFVGKSGEGPLFYNLGQRRKADPRKPPAQTVANKLAAWVRKNGVSDPRVAPNHGWRHRFATECRRHGVSEGAEMALKGHTPKTVGASYGDWPVDVLARELAKLPKVAV